MLGAPAPRHRCEIEYRTTCTTGGILTCLVGFFHADPHRGNLLQTTDGKLCYLDFGMMAEVPATRRYALIGSALGLVNKEVGMVIRNLKTLEFFPPETDTDLIITALNLAIANSTENGQGSTLNFTKLSANIQSISDILPFRLPPFYTLIVRTLTILEGLALYVDPGIAERFVLLTKCPLVSFLNRL